jgi:hypothetical protein
MNMAVLIFLLLIYGVQAFGQSTTEAFDKLTMIVSLKGFQEANEEEKLKTLGLLTSYFKEQERESYDRLYHELLSLDSLTVNSLNLLNKCQNNSPKNPVLNHQCKKLIPNSINKYSLLEKEIQKTLMPLITEFEKRAELNNKTISKEMLGYLNKVLIDLKRRISEFKMIEEDYKSGDFQKAQKKLKIARALLGA